MKKSAALNSRSVPQLVQISVKLIRAGFGHVVDLRSAVSSLIHRVRKRVHRHLGDGVQAENQIGGKSAIQVGERIVGLQTIHDVAI